MYKPLVKQKNFCPNPVVKFGIPDFADSSKDPSVEGTSRWEDWWLEQFYYCLNGYETGGTFIPGRYYYYLNFFIIHSVSIGNHFPLYADLDKEFFDLVEDVKKNKQGIISLKARRKGLSYKVVGGIIDYGFRFGKSGYKAGICAGLREHANDFFEKFKTSNALKPNELAMNIRDGEDGAVHKYEVKRNGIWREGGTQHELFVGTMFNNPNVFKGKGLEDCVFEEAGEFKTLKKGFEATKPCFMLGDMMRGTPFIYGCVCAGTKVWTNSGDLVNIEDLNKREGILGFSDDNQMVSKEEITYWQAPAEKPCYRIETTSGRFLECSEDHPILWSKKGLVISRELPSVNGKRKRLKKKTYRFKRADEISVGGQIVVVNSVPIYGDKVMWEPRLIGWLIGDGSYGPGKTPVLSSCDKEINEYIEERLDTTTDRGHTTKDGRDFKETRIRGICPKLRELGIYGQTKQAKRLPKGVHSYSKDSICELLGGFFDADGHVNEFGGGFRITLTSAVNELLLEVQLLLQKLGIHSSITTINPKQRNRRIREANEYYRLEVRDVDSIISFRDLIKFKVGYKDEKLSVICNYAKTKVSRNPKNLPGVRFESVKSVKYIGIKEIYNLTANTTNTYIANGIVTHNTGGNIQSGSADFVDMWNDAESYNLRKFWVPAKRLLIPYFGGIEGTPLGGEEGEIKEDIPNLKKLKPYERIGVEDVDRAEEVLLADRQKLFLAKNKSAYYDHLQNFPLTEKEAFMRFSGNDFSTEHLNDKLHEITTKGKQYIYYKMNWDMDDSGHLKIPMKTVVTPLTDEELANPNTFEVEKVAAILKEPRPDYLGLDIGGLDSYDLDKSKSSKSLGSMVVYRRGHSIPDELGDLPIAMILYRPATKEVFYDACAMLAVYYNLVRGVAVDIDRPMVMKHFEEIGCGKFLAERPRTFDAPNSRQMHKLGTKFTSYSKPLMIGLMQSFIVAHSEKIEFDRMLDEMLDYDIAQRDSDWDSVDALGLALMKNADMDGTPYKEDEKEMDEAYELGEWIEDSNGYLTRVSSEEAKMRRSMGGFNNDIDYY